MISGWALQFRPALFFMPMYRLLQNILFLLPPERAHHFTMGVFTQLVKLPFLHGVLMRFFTASSSQQGKSLMGLYFKNPVGLAAGFDKDGKYILAMHALGFGFVELGTVTPRPQVGNPQPRLFRLKQDRALINRMGFNNEGVDALVQRLSALKKPADLLLGGNIGKNKDTPNEDALSDYLYGFERLHPWVDYFVVNVSSPNTPNLRALQDKEPLTALLTALQERNRQLPEPRPILLKIAPDLGEEQIRDIADIVQTTGIAGLIATNTTISRSGLHCTPAVLAEIGAGGLSGQPLKIRSTEVISSLRSLLGPSKVIIGVGGVASAADAREKMQAGADLVQVYTGLVYEGPGLVKRILGGL